MTKADHFFFGFLQILAGGFVIAAVALIFVPMLTEAGAPGWYSLSVPGIALVLMLSSRRKAPEFVRGEKQ